MKRAADPKDPRELAIRAAECIARYEEQRDAGSDGRQEVEEAVRLLQGASAQIDPDDRQAPVYRYNLALALQHRYDAIGAASGDTSDLDSAKTLLEAALCGSRQPGSRSDMVAVLAYGLGVVLRRLFAVEHEPGLADRAVRLLEEALLADDRSRLDLADCQYEYGRALLDAADMRDEPALLDDAVRTLETLVTGADSASPDFPAYLDAAGSARLERFERSGRRADVRIACKLAEAAVACQRSRGSLTAAALSNLARCLAAKSASSSATADDLVRAIQLVQQAIQLTGPDAAGTSDYTRDLLAGLRSNLVGFLLDRIDRTGDLDHLDALVALADQAVAGTRAGTPEAGARSHQAAIAHRNRYQRYGDRGDLATALRLHQVALDAPVPARERLAIVDSYGNTLRTRYDLTQDSGDLERAVRAYKEALVATDPESPDRAGRLNNLGAAQAELASVTSDEATAVSATRNLQEAVRQAAPHSLLRIRALINLSNVAADRATSSGDPSYRETALRYYREVEDDIALLGHGTEPLLQAALNAADLADEAEDWAQVVSMSETALGTVDDLLVLQREHRSKESWLRVAQGAADRAALAAIRMDDLPTAVTMLERGRATMLREAIDQTALDLARLERAGGADLRRRLEDARALADTSGESPVGDLSRRSSLRDLRDEIRKVPGFESFLQPESFAGIVAAATDRPLVYLAPGQHSGTALAVRSGEVEPLRLPGFSADEVREHAGCLFQAHASYTIPTRDRAARRAATQAWHAALDRAARWLGEVVGEPVLGMLGNGAAVIVAGGLSSVLPVHAAWWPEEQTASRRKYLLDVLEISYAPSAAALQTASRLAAKVPGGRLLTVADPVPTALPRLASASAETDVAALDAYGAEVTRLRGVDATIPALEAALPDCDLLHAGCHGLADIVDPLRSGLVLAHDQRFTLERLLALRTRIRLAVLSACESGRIGTSLPDEVVSLPSGLIQAGAAGVVASVWAVPDAATLALMAEFYRLWRHGSGDRPAAALARAQAWVRDTSNGDKLASWEQRTRDKQLPENAFDALQDVYLRREPDGLDDALMGAWAPFSHVGV